MLSDDPKHAGSRLSALLGTPVVQQTPQNTSSTTAAASSHSRRSSARNSATMGFPIYEPQSQRPYTPEPASEREREREQTLREEPSPAEPDRSSQQPAPSLPAWPTTPAPAHINTSSSQTPTHRRSLVPSTSSPNLATSPTLHGTPILHSAPDSHKPSFQSHRTVSSTTSFPPPSPDLDLTTIHTSTDPFSPFYLHPTTRTSLEVDRAGINKPFSPSASKTAIISVHPVASNSNSASDLDASLSNLVPPAAAATQAHCGAPYPPYNSHYEKTRRERGGTGWTTNPPQQQGTEGCRSNTLARGGGGGGSSRSCELLRLECQRRRVGRWKGLSARRRLWIKLLVGFLIVGGVVGLVVGLWWRFARLQGGPA